MRLGKAMIGGRSRCVALRNDDVVALDCGDISDALQLTPVALSRLADAGKKTDAEDMRWLPPIRDEALIIGIGLNTKSHFNETAQLMNRVSGDFPHYPRLFTRTCDSMVGHHNAIVVPCVSEQLDYEGEIGLIIGKGGRYITAEEAWGHIGGYTCCNDGSIRDFQMNSSQVTAGKNFVSSGAAGPWMVTADEVPDPMHLTLQTHVNGELRQSLTLDDLIFDFAQLVCYVSQIFLLRAGDMILTGSPAGIGALAGNWLRAGDTVDVTIPQAGTLSVSVAVEATHA